MELVFVVVEQTLDHHVELFLRAKRAARQPRTVQWYENVLRYYKRDTAHLSRDWPPTAEHCLTFIESFEDRKLAESSRDNYFRALRSFINWACECGFIQQNPIPYVDGPDTPRPLPKAPPQEAMKKLLSTVAATASKRWQHARDLALFSLALDTGARISELERMLVSDIDLAHGQISIYGRKVKQGRTLEVGDTALSDLKAWLSWRADLKLPRDLKAVFVSNYQGKNYRRFTAWGMRRALKRWQKRAEIEPFNFHGFRHAYAIYSLRNHADLIDVRDQLGHSTIKTTAIYTQVVDMGRSQRHRKTSPRGNL